MAYIVPSDITRLALAGGHAPELVTLERLQRELGPEYTDVSAPARHRPASLTASRRSVFTRSPARRGIRLGATTSQ